MGRLSGYNLVEVHSNAGVSRILVFLKAGSRFCSSSSEFCATPLNCHFSCLSCCTKWSNQSGFVPLKCFVWKINDQPLWVFEDAHQMQGFPKCVHLSLPQPWENAQVETLSFTPRCYLCWRKTPPRTAELFAWQHRSNQSNQQWTGAAFTIFHVGWLDSWKAFLCMKQNHFNILSLW